MKQSSKQALNRIERATSTFCTRMASESREICRRWTAEADEVKNRDYSEYRAEAASSKRAEAERALEMARGNMSQILKVKLDSLREDYLNSIKGDLETLRRDYTDSLMDTTDTITDKFLETMKIHRDFGLPLERAFIEDCAKWAENSRLLAIVLKSEALRSGYRLEMTGGEEIDKLCDRIEKATRTAITEEMAVIPGFADLYCENGDVTDKFAELMASQIGFSKATGDLLATGKPYSFQLAENTLEDIARQIGREVVPGQGAEVIPC